MYSEKRERVRGGQREREREKRGGGGREREVVDRIKKIKGGQVVAYGFAEKCRN
jgi:hypothetical protein